MQIVTSVAALREVIRQWRQAGHSVGFVPTMGNLHAGHIKLVSTAKQQTDKVVVSIFVNPTQFGPNEDFASYPRTEQQDQEKLIASDADLLFLPAVTEMYPQATQTGISVSGLSALHCGSSRPGHFDGVALVVCKLLNMVQPDLLLLGEKDFQQLTLIRQMVADLNIPVAVQGVATVREDDGLAMSSRNGYLTDQQRQHAPKLYQALIAARDEILAGHVDYPAVAERQRQNLQQAGFAVDYFSICRSKDLLPASTCDANLLILAAAKLGTTRLIDNLYFSKINN
ncbi:pantoate--beta-alanine ligase [Methylomonas sp. LW13]|uniref:pantoate--beta-alanine ligase n=1 Tax=unclassified Methylomonas TaxID=2608980 RepID=UPI00051CAC36|nr:MULTISPECIES: pantoate--beta-alanine ligase [unclassified Methylomonas]PKD40125.1 pantoate--beta-alanine ligase [Methylomonas sp. Kb3]QBC29541.1 pantoate--beta-alanine ligase [Methylomonas sp. LW13]